MLFTRLSKHGVPGVKSFKFYYPAKFLISTDNDGSFVWIAQFDNSELDGIKCFETVSLAMRDQ